MDSGNLTGEKEIGIGTRLHRGGEVLLDLCGSYKGVHLKSLNQHLFYMVFCIFV